MSREYAGCFWGRRPVRDEAGEGGGRGEACGR